MRRSVARTGVLAVACVSLSGLLASWSSRAEPTEPLAMDLATTTCAVEPFSYGELRDKLALFLGAERVTLTKSGQAGALHASLSWDCAKTATEAHLELVSANGVRIDRRIDLADVAPPDRPAVIALAVSETVRALRAMSPGATSASSGVAIVATPSAVSSASIGPATPPSDGTTPTPTATVAPSSNGEVAEPFRKARIGVGLGADAQQFGSSPLLLGARIEASYARLRLGFALLTANAHDALGDATITLWHANLFFAVVATSARTLALDAGPFAHVGRIGVHPSANGSARAAETSEAYLAGGARATATWSPFPDLRLGLALEGGAARGLVARADDRVVAKIDGAFVGGLVFVDVRP